MFELNSGPGCYESKETFIKKSPIKASASVSELFGSKGRSHKQPATAESLTRLKQGRNRAQPLRRKSIDLVMRRQSGKKHYCLALERTTCLRTWARRRRKTGSNSTKESRRPRFIKCRIRPASPLTTRSSDTKKRKTESFSDRGTLTRSSQEKARIELALGIMQ